MKEDKMLKPLYSNEVFGNNLKHLRNSKGYTQKQLVSKFEEYDGITLDIRQYRGYENNSNNSDISSQRLYVLSDILNVSMNDLIGKTFDPKSLEDTVFNSTGISSKAISILKRKMKLQNVRQKRIRKNPIICDAISELGEIDTLNYLITSSNILELLTNNARLAYIRTLELQQNENKLKEELANTKDRKEKASLKKKLQEIKSKKKDIEDLSSFQLYKEVEKTFKQYLHYLRMLDTQHYITEK